MKNIHFKAFTLVEMLIVIVIIGILIAALLPRLSGAQSMARDTARKTALSQIGAGVIAYQAQYGQWPLKNSATGTDHLTDLVSKGLMTEVPKDRLQDNIVSGLSGAITTGDFLYYVGTKNSVPYGGFVLMAHTETPGNSNWVVEGSE
ncbi:MAG: prepilin-type N-terminal cleavage/methylation domain-containing protein [Candidatus Peribacteria bacterium]|jgi:prepilin-type N-terminal cleavage/methylation domain-containing protein|nr:prepilin-type N-terminal cleavage/methylation domain-containing protein [Candidatus Peribacteria bacterium]